MQWYTFAMFAIVLLDLFDRFERRYAIDIDRWAPLPDRWVSWGLVGEGERDGWARHLAVWYLAVRLPSFTYAYNPCQDEYMMGQRALVWLRRRGWREHILFPR